MEPIGLLLGAVSLVGLFTTCLDLLDVISRFNAHDTDFEYLICRLEAEKFLLLKWGEAVGLIQSPNSTFTQKRYYKNLVDKGILNSVEETLNCLKGRFKKVDDILMKYTPHRLKGEIVSTRPRHDLRSTFKVTKARNEKKSKSVQSEISVAMKLRWALHDRKKLSELVTEITELSESLRQLVPTDGSTGADLVLSEVTPDPNPGRFVAFTRVPNPYFVFDTVNFQSSDLIEHGAWIIPRVHDGLQLIAPRHAMDRNNYQEILSAEESTRSNNTCTWQEPTPAETSATIDSSDEITDSLSYPEARDLPVTTRSESDLLEHSSSHKSPEQRRRGWMGDRFFALLAYAVFSFVAIIPITIIYLKVFLPNLKLM